MAFLRTRLVASSLLVCLGACTSEEDSTGGAADGSLLPGAPTASSDASAFPALPGTDGGNNVPVLPPTTPWLDAGPSAVPEAGAARPDASSGPDAALPDAGSPDAALPDASPPAADGGPCAGSAPHGCYKAKAGNDPNCPAQIPEQSGFYPPMSEWKGCQSPLYQACVYLRPDGSEANCSCDFGLHWLCTY